MIDARLQVITDALRDLGLEDVARWVEYPEDVRSLLAYEPIEAGGFDNAICPSCGIEIERDGLLEPHKRTCSMLRRRVLLGLETLAHQADLAWDEAELENRRRSRVVTGPSITTQQINRVFMDMYSSASLPRGESILLADPLLTKLLRKK